MTDKNIEWFLNAKLKTLAELLEKRNITLYYADSEEEALKRFNKLVPEGSEIGLSGSMTLSELGILDRVLTPAYKTINQYEQGISREESMHRRDAGANADVFLSGANAVTYNGKIINFSAFGHRTAGVANAKKVVLFAGTNKLVENLDEAFDRIRNYTVPINSKRLNYQTPCLQELSCHEEICHAPDFVRMCNQALIIEGEVHPDRLFLVIVKGDYGY